jgi:hypothetical protein
MQVAFMRIVILLGMLGWKKRSKEDKKTEGAVSKEDWSAE